MATYYHTFVSPGMGAALQTVLAFKELITILFPTFGWPSNPILTVFLSL